MSTNIEKRAALTALVLAAPRDNPSPEPDGVYCALRRAQVFQGAEGSLTSYAMSLGFSHKEAMGIMNGWDSADGAEQVWAPWYGAHGPEYRDGFKLGQELHRLVSARARSESRV